MGAEVMERDAAGNTQPDVVVFDDSPEALEEAVAREDAMVDAGVGDDPRSWGRHALNPVRAQLDQDAWELEEEKKVAPLPLPTAEQARYWSRELPFDQQAVGVEFTRCGGAQPVNLASFPLSVDFLKPMSPFVAWQTHGTANYIGVSYYADWIRDTVGDTELADAIAPYGATDEVMGIQLDQIRPMIRVRLKQYQQVCPELKGTEKNIPLY